MKLPRPRTFLNLVVLGFVAVSLPLGVGLWTTLTSIDRVTVAGLEVVDHAVSGTRDSEILSNSLRNEERTLRLYSITLEKDYLDKALQYHSATDSLLYDLLGLPLDHQVRKDLEEIRQSRNIQRTILISVRDGTLSDSSENIIDKAIGSFAVQHEQARRIRAGFKAMMKREITELHTTTEEAQKALVSQTVAFILVTIVLIAIMAFLLSWPIRLSACDFGRIKRQIAGCRWASCAQNRGVPMSWIRRAANTIATRARRWSRPVLVDVTIDPRRARAASGEFFSRDGKSMAPLRSCL